MQPTRREFIAGAAVAVGGAIAGLPVRAAAADAIRYAHVDLSAGPWTRSQVLAIAGRVASPAHLGPPASSAVLGDIRDAELLPAEFVMTLAYANGARTVIRASRSHSGPITVLARGDFGSRMFTL